MFKEIPKIKNNNKPLLIIEETNYITFNNRIIDPKNILNLKEFIQSEDFNILYNSVLIKLCKTINFEKLNLIDLFESCQLKNLDNKKVDTLIFTSILKRIQRDIINLKLKENSINNYDDILNIQQIITNVDTYFSFRNMMTFNQEQYEEKVLERKRFIKSKKEFKKYINTLNKRDN